MDGQYPGCKDGGKSARHTEMGELDITQTVAIDVYLHTQRHQVDMLEGSMPKGIEEVSAFVDTIINQDS